MVGQIVKWDKNRISLTYFEFHKTRIRIFYNLSLPEDQVKYLNEYKVKIFDFVMSIRTFSFDENLLINNAALYLGQNEDCEPLRKILLKVYLDKKTKIKGYLIISCKTL